MSSEYFDPKNYDSILEEIKKSPTLKEIYKIIDRIFPDWVVCLLDGFSKDYPHLEKNWQKMCIQLNVRPTKVLIVRDFDFNNENMKLVRIFCEIFTKSGFSVKKVSDYIPCQNCNYAIPVPEVYDKFKLASFSIPDTWSPTCLTQCNRKDSTDIN